MTQDALRHWRRDLHRHPEAAWCEFRTTTLIAQHLTELGFSIMLGINCSPAPSSWDGK